MKVSMRCDRVKCSSLRSPYCGILLVSLPSRFMESARSEIAITSDIFTAKGMFTNIVYRYKPQIKTRFSFDDSWFVSAVQMMLCITLIKSNTFFYLNRNPGDQCACLGKKTNEFVYPTRSNFIILPLNRIPCLLTAST